MAFIRNTDKFVEGSSNKFFSNVRAQLALQPTVDSLQSEDSGIKLRLNVIEGGAGVSGSIAKAQADAQAYADQQIAALVNSAPSVLDTLKELSDAIGGDASFATTIAGQIGDVDDKIDQEILDRQAAISSLESSLGVDISALESADSALDLRLDQLELDPVTKSYVDSEISSEVSARQSGDSSLSGRLDVIEGSGEGSLVKAEQDAKDYADSLDSAMDSRVSVLESDPTTKSYVDGIESALDGRLDILEQDPTTKTYVDGVQSGLDSRLDIIEGLDNVEGSVAKAEKDAKDYADSLDSAMDSRVLALEADPVSKSYVDSADSAIDSRLDILEGLDSVEGSVAKAEKDAKDYADSLDSAMDSRVSVLESDPVTKTYVDGIQSSLDSRLDVLEGVDSVEGSVAKAEKDAKDYADQKIADLVNSAPAVLDTLKELSDALGGDENFATTVAGQIGDVDAKVDQEISDRQSADSALDMRLDVLEGSGEGSVAKAEQDAKDYADSLNSAMDSRVDSLEADSVTKSYVDSADSTLQSNINNLFSTKTTSDLTEGSNMYYTEARFDNRFAVKSTSNLTEGSNLYFTNARAKSASVVNSSSGSETDQAMSVSAAKSYIDTADNARLKLDGSNSMTGTLKLPSGTNSAPSLTFSGATTSGFNRASNDVITIVRAGSPRIHIEGSLTQIPAGYFWPEKGLRLGRSAVSGNTSLTTGGSVIYGVNSVSGQVLVSLPLSAPSGYYFIIKDETGSVDSSNYIRVQGSGGQTIDGAAYYDIVIPYESITVYSNGTNWFII